MDANMYNVYLLGGSQGDMQIQRPTCRSYSRK